MNNKIPVHIGFFGLRKSITLLLFAATLVALPAQQFSASFSCDTCQASVIAYASLMQPEPRPWSHDEVLSTTGFDFLKDLRPGDLIFQDLDCGPLCDAIEKVTEGAGGKDFSHLGMVLRSGDTLAIVEAIGSAVQLTGIQRFVQRSKTTDGRPKVVVARLKPRWHALVDSATVAAGNMVGIPYDESFLPDNGRLYCSEMVALAFQSANKGKPFFQQLPMTFKDPDTEQFFPVWMDYYKQLKMDIPEGRPGCNPGGLSHDDKLEIIWLNY